MGKEAKLEEIILNDQVRNFEQAEVVISFIDKLIEKYPKLFKQSAHFQLGKFMKQDEFSITVRAFCTLFDEWSKTYTVEVPGKNGRLMFCAEKVGAFEGGESKINSVFIIEDGGLSELKKFERKKKKKKKRS